MSNPGKVFAGVVITAAGVLVTPLPGGQFFGPALMMYGTGMIYSGVVGDPDTDGKGSQFTATTSQGALPVIYGERKVSHYYADVRTHGTENSWLDTIAGVCIAGESGKGIEGIIGIWLYREELTVPNPTNTNTNSDGHTTNVDSKYYKDPDWHYRYSIGKGSDTQATDARMALLFPDEWGVSSTLPHQEGRGIVTVFSGFFWDKDEEDNVWVRGRPDQDIMYSVKGALLYDPRYPNDGPDSDGWIWDNSDSPLASTDNHPGQNPSLQVLDYLTSKRYGLSIPYSSRGAAWGTTDEIDEQSFIDHAEHCDEQVTTTGLASNETNPRYTSNAIISTGDSHKSNLERLLGASNAMLAYEGGKFKILSRKVKTAVTYEITESEIIGELTLTREGTTVPNIITLRYPNQANNYVFDTVTWPYSAFDINQNGFLEADNGIVSEHRADLPAVTYFVHAQQLAITMLKEMREDVVVELKCRESAIQLSVGDVVKLTYDSAGWTQKLFWIVGMEIFIDGTVGLKLKEYAASVYNLDPNSDIPTVPGTDLPDPFSVIAPTAVTANCAAGYYLNDGVFVPRVEITWTHSTDEFAHEEELVYRKDADAEWVFTGMKKKIADTAVITWESDLEIGEDYWFGVVAWNRIDVRSAVAETAAFCTITPPSDTPADVTITASDYTCLEGITITWDDPAVYTAADDIGVLEIAFYSVEIREQGAGATELDRWNAGTMLDRSLNQEWNFPFDRTTKTTYDLSLRRFDRFGSPASTPTEVQLVNNDWPCAGFGENEPSEYGAMIHNGGFENGGRWWYSAVGGAISASSPLAESYSLAMTAGGAVRTCRQVSDLQDDITLGVGEDHFIKVNEGDWFVLGTYGSTTGATGRVRARTYDRDKALQATVDVVTFTSSTPIRKSAFININTDIEYLVIECSIDAGSGVAKFDAMGAWLYPPRIPTIKEIITYPTTSSGKLEIEINAGTSVLQSVEMKKYEDQVWDAGWTDVTPSPYDMTVALNEKHPSAITYRVGYDLTATGTGAIEYIEINVPFDIDTLPELGTPSFDVDADTGGVILHWSGDDDVSYIKWITTDTDWGTPALARTAAQGGTVANNRSGSVALSGTGIPIPESDAAYVAILAYTVGDIESIEVYRATVTRGSTGIIVPTIQSQMDYSGSNGTITLVINDPQTRVTLVEWRAKTGPPDTPWPGTWTTDTGPPPTYNDPTVALDEKYDSNIAWRVKYTDPSGAVFLEGNATFDSDRLPEVGSFGIAIADDGAPTLNYHGDDDVNSIEWAFEIGVPPAANQPTAAETRASGNYNSGSRSEGALPITGGTVGVGETIFVSFFAYTGVDDGGVESAILYECQETRYTSTSIILPTIQAQVTDVNEVTLVLNDPQGHVNQVGFREYERNVGTNVMEWGSWSYTTSPYTLVQTLTLDEKHNTIVAWQVRYDYGPGNKLIENVIVFDTDTIPEINSVNVKANDAGVVYLAYSGDDDCLSVKWKTSTSAFPDYSTTTTTGTVSNFSAATNINIGSINEGETIYVSVAAYPEASGGGTANTDMGWGSDTYGTDTKYDTVPANVTTFGSLKYIRATVARIRLYWTPVTTEGVTHYEIRYGGTGWADATFEAELASTGYTITYGEIPSSSRTYRIKAMNRLEGLESVTAANTTVSWSSRPSGGAVSLVSSYWRGTGGLMRFNLATTNGTIFRFHWGTLVGFTPTDANVMALITEDNPTADYAVGLSVAETGWTTDAGRVLYCKVGVKDGASDDLGEGWSYSSGFQFTMNPFEVVHINESTTLREFINGAYTDSTRRPEKLRTAIGDLDADDALDLTIDDTDDLSQGGTRQLALGTYLDGSYRPEKLRTAVGDLDADDALDLTIDDTDDLTQGSVRQLTASGYLDGSWRPEKLRTAVGDLDADDAFDLTIDDTDDLTSGSTRKLVLGTYLDASLRPDTLRQSSPIGDVPANDVFDHTVDDTDDLTSGSTRKLVLGTYLDSSLRPDTLRQSSPIGDVPANDVFDHTVDDVDDLDTTGTTRSLTLKSYLDASFRPDTLRHSSGDITATTVQGRTQYFDGSGDMIDDIFLDEANAILYGSTGGGGTYVEKVLLLGVGNFIPFSHTTEFTYNVSSLSPYRTQVNLQRFAATFTLPVGSVIVKMEARGYRYQTSSAVCAVGTWRANDIGGATGIGLSVNHGTTGWTTLSDTASETVGSYPYHLQLDLENPTTGVGQESKLGWVKIYYRVSSLEEGI